jgi:hypothetical protein
MRTKEEQCPQPMLRPGKAGGITTTIWRLTKKEYRSITVMLPRTYNQKITSEIYVFA